MIAPHPTSTAPRQTLAPPRPGGAGAAGTALARRAWKLACSAALLVSVALLVFLAVGPRVFGYQTASMLSGSMAPHIPVGAVVVDFPESAGSLRVGQVVTYHVPVGDHHVESHRVVRLWRTATGQVAFVTAGDANRGVDPWVAQVAPSSTMWRVTAVVPQLGRVIHGLRAPVLGTVLRLGALAVFVIFALVSIWRPGPDRATADQLSPDPIPAGPGDR